MKKITFALSCGLLLYSFNAFAIFEAKPVAAMVSTLESENLVYKETGAVFGFDSTQSCLFVSDNFIVLKNYCFPKKEYPARSYTIISAKFGMVDLYDEDFGNDVHKHDVQQSLFSEPMQKYLNEPLTKATIESISAIIKDAYYKHGAACWSTNFDYNNHQPVVNCNTKEVTDFDLWAKETQTLTGDKNAWNILLDKVEAKLNQ